MEKNLRKMVEDEILYGRHDEIIGGMSQSDRQLYECQDFEFTNSGFLMKKRNPIDPDYDWDVLAFIKNNPDLEETVRVMLDNGERLLRSIYTDRETFLTWLEFFNQLNEEGYCLGDHVDINETFTEVEGDAMDYVDSGFSIETVGNRGIYYIEQDTEDDRDMYSQQIDPYKVTHSLPRDKYKSVAYVGHNEEDQEGVRDAERREDTLRKIEQALKPARHRTYVAKMRTRLSEMWNEDKQVYAALKTRKMTLDEASGEMHLTVKQWNVAFDTVDKAWIRACIYDEWYFSSEQKTKRRVRSNLLRDRYQVQAINAKALGTVENVMTMANSSRRAGSLWKKDYKDVYNTATMQWKLLKSQT